MNRRRFLGTLAAASCFPPRCAQAAAVEVHFRKSSPQERLTSFILPGNDGFENEKLAGEISALLKQLPTTRALPLAPEFHGVSPLPIRYREVGNRCFDAEFSTHEGGFEEGLQQWLDSLGKIRQMRFFVLPGPRIRYEIQGASSRGIEYRVGFWEQQWKDGRLTAFRPLCETLACSPSPLFRDVTAELFGRCSSFREQMLRGVPYWRARLDSASGIDIYGSNGIAVGDIDNDGWDEVYVCQPGGLPNRLYQFRDGAFADITSQAGVGLLDDTSCALFLDLRNSGMQDLVVLRSSGPVLFLNEGNGRFALRTDAFAFRTKPQGSFTGMSAADYNRDGRLDLYLCTYTFFQSEDQYRYPVPYHDAQNGPRNFLFRNALARDGSGVLEDVTTEVGLDQNNNRFSFAPAWCDYNADGWPDLYVANDFGRNNLYRNRDGFFEDVAPQAGVEDLGPGMSAAWFDYDGDGLADLYVSNMWSDSGQRVASDPAFRAAATPALREAYQRHAKGNSLYRNRGDGSFQETSPREQVEMGRWAWSADARDFDNDGDPEIYITCGMLSEPKEIDLASFFWRQVVAKSPVSAERSEAYETGWNAINQFIREDYSWNGREPNVFYVRHNGRYYDVSGISGVDCALDSRAFAVTDFDGDGNLDLLVKSRLAPQLKAFRNECAGTRKSIAVRLTGIASNRDAIGARVEAGGNVQFLQAGSGFLSQHTKTLYFGLGSKETTNLTIVWPSGLRQEFHGLKAGFRYEITEGSPTLHRRPFSPSSWRAAPEMPAADNQPRAHDLWLLEPVPLPDSRKGPGLLYLGEGKPPELHGSVEGIDFSSETADVAACYALLRRYLLDWRTSLTLPFALLIDDRSRIHKIYASVPDAQTLAADLQRIREPGRERLALPFPGDYVGLPRRNYFKLGAAFYWAGYPEQALVYLQEVVRQAPQNGKALNAIGQIHLDSGRLSQARSFLERAVAANPLLGEAWNNLGGVDLAEGKLEAAREHYRRAIRLLPQEAYPLLNAGEVEEKLGNIAAARTLFTQAMAADPVDPEAPNQLGLLAAREGRLAEAQTWFQKAIALRHDYAGAINNLGVLYSQMGQTGDAIAAFEYGIRVAPDEALFYMNLGRMYVREGNFIKAREVMRRLLERKPGDAAALHALRELEGR
jgi:tetratricopeptide (TPR) repeat protein